MSQKSRTAEATLQLLSDVGMEESRLSPEDTFPAVPVTSRITALMELAATRLVQQELRGEEVSVGIAMNVTHAAPALAAGVISGGRVRAVASYCHAAGHVAGNHTGKSASDTPRRLHYMVIDAFDESGLIARAEHTRAIVIGRRLEALARRRAGLRSMLLAV